MLSPEADLRALVRSLATPTDVDERDHLPLSDVRALVARAMRATIDIEGRSTTELNDTVRFALIDLDRGSAKPRSGL